MKAAAPLFVHGSGSGSGRVQPRIIAGAQPPAMIVVGIAHHSGDGDPEQRDRHDHHENPSST